MNKSAKNLFLSALLLHFGISNAQVNFENVASESNITHYDSAMGRAGGVSFYDFNGDGLDDLTIATGIGDSILFYVSDGCKFNKIPSLVDNLSDVMQVLWADIDNDGDQDLVATSYRYGARLYENTGNLVMQDISVSAGIDTSNYFTYGANFADYDNDGDLDLYINNYIFGDTISNMLYRNNGNHTFTDVTKAAGLWDTNTFSFATGFFDYDKDGWIDLYTTTDKQTFPNQLYHNNGNGTFTNTSVASNTLMYVDAMSATVDDYNNDGWLDFLVTNTQSGNVLLHNNGNGQFTDTASGSGVLMNSWAWGAAFLDMENDMDLDVFICTEINWISPLVKSTLYSNNGFGYFMPKPVANMNNVAGRSYSNSIGDYNNDGFMDIAVINLYQPPFIWKNSTKGGNYLKFELEGTASNRDAIGAFIYTYVGGIQQLRYMSSGESFIGQFSQYETVGLGANTVVDSVIVVWPSGLESRLYQLPVNKRIKIIEGTASPRLSIAVIGGLNKCEGDSTEIIALNSFDEYLWNTGDSTSFIKTDSAGVYNLLASNMIGPSASIQTTIKAIDIPSFDLGNDTALCGGENYSLKLPQVSACFEWPDGSSDSIFLIEKTGTYFLEASFQGCKYADSVHVTLISSESIFLGADTTICAKDSIILDAGPNWNSYYWSDNSTSQTLVVRQSGNYFVEAIDSNQCVSTDEIEVIVTPCLSVKEYNKNDDLIVLPNPTSDKAIINLKNKKESIERILVYSMEGAQVQAIEDINQNNYSLDVSNYPSGLYFLQIQTTQSIYKSSLMVN